MPYHKCWKVVPLEDKQRLKGYGIEWQESMVKCIHVTAIEIKYMKPGYLGNKYRNKNLLKNRYNQARKMHNISIFVTTERHELKTSWTLSNKMKQKLRLCWPTCQQKSSYPKQITQWNLIQHIEKILMSYAATHGLLSSKLEGATRNSLGGVSDVRKELSRIVWCLCLGNSSEAGRLAESWNCLSMLPFSIAA